MRHTVGDVIEAHHPWFAVIVTAVLIIGAALLIVGGVAFFVSDGLNTARAILGWGIAIVLLAAVAILAMVFVTVFPALGIGLVCFVSIGVAVGLGLRKRAHHGAPPIG